MAGSRKSIQRLLERHKLQISRELEHSGILTQLVKKGVVNHEEESKLKSEVNLTARADLFVEVLSKKGFNAFREMCNALELECPHLLTSLEKSWSRFSKFSASFQLTLKTVRQTFVVNFSIFVANNSINF